MFPPLSYYRLGAIFPRDRLRGPYPEVGRGLARRLAELVADLASPAAPRRLLRRVRLLAAFTGRVPLAAVPTDRIRLTARGDDMADPGPQTFRLAVSQAVVLEPRRTSAPPASLAGWAMRFRLFRPDGTFVVKTTGGGGVVAVDGPTEWGWDVTLEDTDTALPVSLLAWDLWRTDDGSESPEAYGTVDVYDTRRG